MAQQIHYATSWVIIKEAQFTKAVESLRHPGLALGGASQKVDVILFFIRESVRVLENYPNADYRVEFYCYNVMSLNILFW